jgi:Transmembrane protein of unknown function (DUF3556)
VSLLDPEKPPYDALAWLTKPLPERARLVCQAWALQGYGAPTIIFAAYALKIALYVAGWLAFCHTTPALSKLADIGSWWLHPLAFQKAIVYSMLFEVLGLGCGSGPLTGRYVPPLGGFRYFLRPGTTKLPLLRWRFLGGARRSWLDVALYLALLLCALRVLIAPAPTARDFLPLVVLLPLLGVLDKTIFLAARSEHYWTTLVCFAFAPNWLAGAMAVQLALWFWAGFSKLNPHFPAVVCVMASNSPVLRSHRLRRLMYRQFPDDLRPSRLATVLARAGTALELAVPLTFLATPLGAAPWLAVALMLLLHGFITSSVPMGVPLEWNLMVAYGGFALFWAHPELSLRALGSLPVSLFLLAMLVALPLLGNLMPRALSFLLAMRYYAGNWAYSVWLFRGASSAKLRRLTLSADLVDAQLARFYDRRTAVALASKVMGFRMMHLHGRALPLLLPRAVPHFEDYEYVDGEIIAGLVLGWNFGDGHLHDEQLLAAVQAGCSFEAGELRCIFVESQPLAGDSLSYRIVDACTGMLERGELPVSELGTRQPWSSTG